MSAANEAPIRGETAASDRGASAAKPGASDACSSSGGANAGNESNVSQGHSNLDPQEGQSTRM
jgi:hypothetical protein